MCNERRRAVPRRELRPLGGVGAHMSAAGPSQGANSAPPRGGGGSHERRRAVPRRELRPLGGQRSGDSRKRGGWLDDRPRYGQSNDLVA